MKMSQLCLKVSLFLQSGHEIETVGDHTNYQATGPARPVSRPTEIKIIMFISSARYNKVTEPTKILEQSRNRALGPHLKSILQGLT